MTLGPDSDNAHDRVGSVLSLLDMHFRQFYEIDATASQTGHPTPSDTRGWSQIIVSQLVGVDGRERKKGPDLADGSDVKAALMWSAIDTPRFNGVLKTRTKAEYAGNLKSLDETPHLFFVLWDAILPDKEVHRCRIWCVRPKVDPLFSGMAQKFFDVVSSGNFQLHPPRKETSDTNIIRNDLGTFEYPLLFCATRLPGKDQKYVLKLYDRNVLESGLCKVPTPKEQELVSLEARSEDAGSS